MRSWTIAATALVTTASGLSQRTYSRSFSTETQTSYTDAPLGVSRSISTTSSSSSSEYRSSETVSSIGTNSISRTTLSVTSSEFSSASGGTTTSSNSSGQTISTAAGSNSYSYSLQISTTLGGALTNVFTRSIRTSTTTTATSQVWSAMQSSGAYPAGATTVRFSVGESATVLTVDGKTSLTTTTPPTTYWYFRTSAGTVTRTSVVNTPSTVTGVVSATVWEAEPNEVLYSLATQSFASAPLAARTLAISTTRITVTPVRETVSLQITSNSATSATTTTYETLTQASRELTYLGPDSQTTTGYFYDVLTEGTLTLPMNFSFTSSAPATGAGVVGVSSTSSVFEQNTYGPTPVVAKVFSPNSALTSQQRWGRFGWVIDGQSGSTVEPNLSLNLDDLTGSFTRGRRTILDVTRSDLTIEMPSITYRTQSNGEATTSSAIFFAAGTAPANLDPVVIPHFGGGVLASEWTVIEGAAPNVVYSDLVNSTTTSFSGNDTSRKDTDSQVSVSHLTAEPYLFGGDRSIIPVDVLWWSAARHETAVLA